MFSVITVLYFKSNKKLYFASSTESVWQKEFEKMAMVSYVLNYSISNGKFWVQSINEKNYEK